MNEPHDKELREVQIHGTLWLRVISCVGMGTHVALMVGGMPVWWCNYARD